MPDYTDSNTPFPPTLRLVHAQELSLAQLQARYEAAQAAASRFADQAGDLPPDRAAAVRSKLDKVDELLAEAALEGGLHVPELQS